MLKQTLFITFILMQLKIGLTCLPILTLPTPSNIVHSIKDIFDKVIPSTVDYENLNENLAVLVSWYLIDYVPFFCKHFCNAATRHIPHPHSKKMSKKSAIVSVLAHYYK